MGALTTEPEELGNVRPTTLLQFVRATKRFSWPAVIIGLHSRLNIHGLSTGQFLPKGKRYKSYKTTWSMEDFDPSESPLVYQIVVTHNNWSSIASAEQFWEVLDFSKIKCVMPVGKQLYTNVVFKIINYQKLPNLCYVIFQSFSTNPGLFVTVKSQFSDN